MLTWNGWREVPGHGITDTALAGASLHTSSGVKKYYLFGRGLDNTIWLNWTSDFKQWSGWTQVGGGGTTNVALTATSFPKTLTNPRLYLFGKGLTDNRIYVNSMNSTNDTWEGWSEVPGGGITDAPLTVAKYGTTVQDRLHLFGKGMDDLVYVNSTLDTKNWTGWKVVPGMSTNVAVSAGTSPVAGDNRLHLVCVNKQDNQIYLNHSGKGDYELKTWSGWKPLDGGGTTDAPVVGASFNLSVHYFAKGIGDKRIYALDSEKGWTWQEVPGGWTTDAGVAHISTGATGSLNERLYLFAKGIDDKRIYMNEGAR